MRGNHRRDHAAFAVADEAGFLWINFLAGFQVSEGGLGIAGKVFRRRGRIVASGLADAAFIETKNGDAFSRQVVGQHEERAMSNDRFISIVRPGTAPKYGARKLSP